jgi:mannonate dehydratase
MSGKIAAVDIVVTSPGRNYVTVKITTTDGIVGWGDATLNGRELAVASYLRDHLAHVLVGRSADRIEDTWQYLYRGAYWRRGPVTMTAIGGVDLALWDIKGKSLGVPVYQLLGGACRDRILAYTHATGWDLAELIDSVEVRREQGYRAVRAQFGVPGLETVYGVTRRSAAYEPASRGDVPLEETWDTASYLRHAPRVLVSLREHVGPELHLLHDAHHRLDPTEASRLARGLEPADLYWLEDVIPAENQRLLRAVREASVTPLAIGEVFTTIWDCHELISERLIDYIRMAVTHGGGLSHLRKVLSYAEVHQVKAGPHGPSDISPIAMAASLHLGLATSNFGIQEFMGYPDPVDDVFQADYRFDDGYLHPGDAPGLGVSVQEDAAGRFPYQRAYLPVARTLDGAMKDW